MTPCPAGRRAPRAHPARGVRSAGGPAGPPVPRLRPRRGGRADRGHRGARGVAARRPAEQPGRLAADGRAAQRPRPGPPPLRARRRSRCGSHRPEPVEATSTRRRRPDGHTDDRLALLFACCHPALAPEARLALTLRAVVGMTTPQIARAFLVNERTLAQRIVRAKRKIVTAGIALTVPADDVLAERLADVLAVVALMYNEGFVSSDGGTQDRDLAGDAVWLAGVVATSLPGRGRGVGAGRAADVPARPRRRAVLRRGRPGAAARPGPVAVGPRRHRGRRGDARARGGAALPRAVPAARRHRGLPRDQPVVGRDRLAPDRRRCSRC